MQYDGHVPQSGEHDAQSSQMSQVPSPQVDEHVPQSIEVACSKYAPRMQLPSIRGVEAARVRLATPDASRLWRPSVATTIAAARPKRPLW